MATDNNIHTIVLKSSGSDNIGHAQNDGVVVYWVFPTDNNIDSPICLSPISSVSAETTYAGAIRSSLQWFWVWMM
jgi:hypothetical protein